LTSRPYEPAEVVGIVGRASHRLIDPRTSCVPRTTMDVVLMSTMADFRRPLATFYVVSPQAALPPVDWEHACQ
ncbi:hypothetical protein KCU88_g416, partial [Aureobasidium melanogenum]